MVQEVFSRLSRMDDLAERLPPDGVRNRSFIFRVANNYVRDLDRRQSVRNRYLQERQAEQGMDAEVSNMTPERQVHADQQLSRLKEMIMALKPKCPGSVLFAIVFWVKPTGKSLLIWGCQSNRLKNTCNRRY